MQTFEAPSLQRLKTNVSPAGKYKDFFSPATIQPKLTINQPNDVYEQEADAMADKVMRMEQPGIQLKPLPINSIQRKCKHCEEEEKKMQRKEMNGGETTADNNLESYVSELSSGGQPLPNEVRSFYEPGFSNVKAYTNSVATIQRKCAHCEEEERKMQRKEMNDEETTADNNLESYVSELSTGGQPLPNEVRSFYEPRFGFNFSKVKVHKDNVAAKSAGSVNALAYTSGNNIVFNSGQYSPETESGKRLLGHELTHVVQQSKPRGNTVQRKTDTEAPEFGDIEFDANCPTGPTQLGKVEPDPPCAADTSAADDTGWKAFRFCVGSDTFSDPQSPGFLKNFAREHPALARFTVHTYASVEGNKKENENLSCHRARRVARELINAGVAPEQIDIVGKGITNKFGQKSEANRVVVLNTDITDVPDLQEMDADASPQDIVNKAIDAISSGNYRLAADAYLSFWTCGQIPTLRDAVRRVEVTVNTKIPSGKAKDEDVKKDGTPLEDEEFNQIILHPDTFSTVNPLECAIARIIDMTFHHMVLPNIPGAGNFRKRHLGGTFLVELAGYMLCQDAKASTTREPRQTSDPLQGLEPKGCTQTDLPGAHGSDKGHPRLGHKPVLFNLTESGLKPITGGVNFKVDLNKNMAELAMADTFDLNANVSISGDAAEIPGYEVGYIRTILADQSFIKYVSGFQLQLKSPAPIRDAEAGTPAPWPKTNFITTPAEGDSAVSVAMKDSPNPKKLKFIYAIADKKALPIDPVAENIASMVTRNVTLGIWLIARRKDAPLERFDTQFLDGTIIDIAQIADIVNTNATGSTDFILTNPLADAGPARLTGPIPSDYHELATGAQSSTGLGEKRIVERETAPDRTEASVNGVDKKTYQAELEKIAAPIRKEMGLTQALLLNVLLDKRTGRMWVPSALNGVFKNILPIQAGVSNLETEYVPKDVLDRFAERLFTLARKDLVLKDKTKRGGEKELSFEKVNFTLGSLGTAPQKFQHMHTRPGVMDEMRKLWKLTEADHRENEWSATIAFDREKNQMIVPLERVKGGKLIKTDGVITGRVQICAQKNLPGLHQTILGTIHTHPIFDSSDAEGPSGPDKKIALDTENIGDVERHLCGIDHYIIGVENVVRFSGNGVVEDVGDRRDVLGD